MDDTDIALVLNLLESPDTSNKELAKRIDVSQATISRRRKRLEEDNIILGTSLRINFSKLDMKLYSMILVPSEPFSRTIIQFQHFFKNHSYTSYQNRIYGRYNALFVQLNLPAHTQTTTMVENFLEKLLASELIKEYELFEPIAAKKIYPIDTSKYDMRLRTFKIDYNQIRKVIRSEYSPLPLVEEEPATSSILEPINLKIIRQLFIDSSRPLREIGEVIGGVSKQEVSRRMKDMNVREWGFVLRYDREQFGVFNQALYVLNNNETALASLDKALQHFPFAVDIYPCREHLIVQVNLPAVDVTQFTDILKERFNQVDLLLLGRQPLSYPPWEGNLSNGKWNLTMETLIKTYNEDGDLVNIESYFDKLSATDLDSLQKQLYEGTN